MIVQGGQLINAGRGLPAEDFVRVGSSEECFVGEPVEFPHAALGLGPERNAGVVGGRQHISFAGKVILGAWPPRERSSLSIAGRNGGGNFRGTPARSKSASKSDGQNS